MAEHSRHDHRPRQTARQERSGKALVDGSNVAHSSEGGQGRLRNIELVVEKLREDGFEPIVVADAALRHQIDQPEKYEAMIDAGEIRQAPAGTDADFFILSFARELDANIVSNDRFRDRLESFPDARDRMIRFMIVEDEVVFEKRNRRRRKQ
jgi:Zc3h12a-like ribonuclease protein